MPRNGRDWKQILKREVSRILAWIALLAVLLAYPLLLLALSAIALFHYLRPTRNPSETENAGSAPSS